MTEARSCAILTVVKKEAKKERTKTMTKTTTKSLRGLTIGELKELLKDVDDAIEIDVWDELGLLTTTEIEVVEYDHGTTDVNITLDGIYPTY